MPKLTLIKCCQCGKQIERDAAMELRKGWYVARKVSVYVRHEVYTWVEADSFDEAMDIARSLDMRYCCAQVVKE